MSAWNPASGGPRAQGRERCTLAVEAGDQLAAEADAQAVIEQLVHEHRAASEVKTVAQTGKLQAKLAEGDRVVVRDHPLVLERDEQSDVNRGQARECAPRLGGLHGEAAVEVRDEDVVEITVGLLVRADAVQAQLLREPSLEGPEAALASSPSLRRARQDLADPERAQHPSHLSRLLFSWALARLRRPAEVATAVGVELAKAPLAPQH